MTPELYMFFTDMCKSRYMIKKEEIVIKERSVSLELSKIAKVTKDVGAMPNKGCSRCS